MCKTLPSKKSHSLPGNSHASNSNVGAKEPSTEQQGHTVTDTATCSTTHLVQTNLRHGSSRGRDRIFEHTTHFNSFRTAHCFGLPMLGREDWRRGNLQKMRNGAC